MKSTTDPPSLIVAIVLIGALSQSVAAADDASALLSFDTGLTISKVRTAYADGRSYIVASSYEGTVLGMDYEGTVLWKNTLSGFMNRDVWCDDITGDGSDEVLAANANGTVYCLGDQGELRWKFKRNDAPMNAVCVVEHDGKPYVVCGGYDKNVYYLSAQGELIKTIPSSDYSVEKSWGKAAEKRIPPKYLHVANFLRKIRGPDGLHVLAVHGTLNSNATQGSIYLFHPLEEKPFQTISKIVAGSTYGDFRTSDVNRDGVDEIILGSSSMIQDAAAVRIDLTSGDQKALEMQDLRRRIDGFGYRVAQTVSIGNPGSERYLILFGSRILVAPVDLDINETEVLRCGYSFNDLWKDPSTGHVILGSAQSGGSCIHVIDTSNPQWKSAYTKFKPSGKLRNVLDNTATVRRQLQSFKRPPHEREPLPVYFMTESLSGDLEERALDLTARYGSPVFLQGKHMPMVEDWDRSGIECEKYRDRRDRRKQYVLTQQQALNRILPLYNTRRAGIAFWGGHGNDPYMFSTDTMMKVADAAGGKKSVFIYPELEHYGDGFDYVLDNHFYPMAEHFQGKNAQIYVRTKHAFWQSIIYMPLWSRLLSGEFADVFIPSMEETTDKTMEQSVAGRVGVWASGAVNHWGARCARDNASYDRLRQHSHQMIPNHFLRAMTYNIACGATYLNNFPVNQQYFSILYELIAKGALYVPKRSEIVSFSPVRLSMTQPDKHYLDEGNNVKWLTFYDGDFERDNPFVFSRLGGTWPGAPVTQWDFSRYAAGVEERRLNFLPPYQNGLVLITPPQHGTFAAIDSPRGALADHLHPLYKTILKEYTTDGRHYYSSDGMQTHAADEYYRTIEADIQQSAKLLPLTVSGNVAWVAAQTASKHLRLTVIDSGYINPKARTATVSFYTVDPVNMVDVLGKTRFDLTDPSSVKVHVPCGAFRFIDIELKEPLGLEQSR